MKKRYLVLYFSEGPKEIKSVSSDYQVGEEQLKTFPQNVIAYEVVERDELIYDGAFKAKRPESITGKRHLTRQEILYIRGYI